MSTSATATPLPYAIYSPEVGPPFLLWGVEILCWAPVGLCLLQAMDLKIVQVVEAVMEEEARRLWEQQCFPLWSL